MQLLNRYSRKLVGLAKQRKHSEIEKVMRSWGESVLSQIEEASLALCLIYKSLVEKICPNAVITADRFHVMKLVNTVQEAGQANQRIPDEQGKSICDDSGTGSADSESR